MKKIGVVGLGNHGKKYLHFFCNRKFDVFGCCKTHTTKSQIEEKYSIPVFLDYKALIASHSFDFIVLSLPSEIQGKIAIDIAQKVERSTHILVELPICDFAHERRALENYPHVGFFVEEYYSVLGRFLRKIDIAKLRFIEVEMYVSGEDFGDKKSQDINIIHLMNNFMGLFIDYNIFQIRFRHHENPNVFYEVLFEYAGKKCKYRFFDEKYLMIDGKVIAEESNFDFVLTSLLEDFSPALKAKKDFNRIFEILENK